MIKRLNYFATASCLVDNGTGYPASACAGDGLHNKTGVLNMIKQQFRLVLVASAFIASLINGRQVWASCFGKSCDGRDPIIESCNNDVMDGPRASNDDYVSVWIRKTAACGGVKWPSAWMDPSCGSVFSTWLEDSSRRELPGTRYTQSALSEPPSPQIYGNMWSGSVKACVQGCDRSACTALDP